jgi:hypothetical protein
MKTRMDDNLDKLEQENHLTGNSLSGILACLFLVLVFNYYQFQLLFFLIAINPAMLLLGGIWFVIFFMIQAGIISVVYRKLSNKNFVIYSPIKSPREFARFILLIVFTTAFFAFSLGYLYPYQVYSTSLIYEVFFSLISLTISSVYWKYVEMYRKGTVYVPKFSEYNLMAWITVGGCLLIFGSVAAIDPYSFIGPIGFGVWLILLARFLIGE